jgi:hypothetical protein
MASRYTRRLTSVRFEDANGLGMTVEPTEGDFTLGEMNAENVEHLKVMNRDQHDGFVKGADLVQEFSITVQMKNEALTHAVNARIIDFLQKRGSFSAAVSMDSTIWAWKTILTFNDGTTSTTRTLPLCEGGHTLTEGMPSNTFQITGRNHSAPTDA